MFLTGPLLQTRLRSHRPVSLRRYALSAVLIRRRSRLGSELPHVLRLCRLRRYLPMGSLLSYLAISSVCRSRRVALCRRSTTLA
jgi:hypothetical protein